MKRLIFILLFPAIVLAQDTVKVVGPKASGRSGEWKQFIITQSTASIVQEAGTISLPSGGGSTDSSIFATVYQLGLKANLADMNTALSGKAANSHGHVISEVTNLQTTLNYKLGVLNYSVGDTTAFATTATRLAIYISGCRDNQIWDATPRKPANTTLPVAGDFLAVSPKWDSLVVKRAAGTTSGLKVNYWRIK